MTVSAIEQQIEYLKNEIKDGHLTDKKLIEKYGNLIYLSKLFKEASEQIFDLVYQEHEKFEKTDRFGDYEITRKDGSRRYKYDHIKEWVELKEKVANIERKAKQVALVGGTVVDKDSGEIIEPAIIEYGKSSLTVKLKR